MFTEPEKIAESTLTPALLVSISRTMLNCPGFTAPLNISGTSGTMLSYDDATPGPGLLTAMRTFR
ncbi:hypothetical protein D3C80_1198800 [compost metagenome]